MDTTFNDFGYFEREELDASADFTIRNYPLLGVVHLHRGPKRTRIIWKPLSSLRANASEPLKMMISNVFLTAAVKLRRPGNGIQVNKTQIKVSVPTKNTGLETLEALAEPLTAIWNMAKMLAVELPAEIAALR